MQTATPSSTLLGGLSPAEFLDEHWQTKPLVIRGALPDFTSPIAPEELAGLACEEGVTSRLILEQGGDYPWQLKEGPFDEDDFLGLPETHWTVLVQEVDRLIPEVGALLDHFRFIPRWRIDDVMVSYAPTHGNVGAHIDNYDVFLLQGLGQREWQFGHAPVDDETIVPDRDVRMLADFTPDETVVLEPGDMLYLPPRIAHHGIALDDRCMTYSVGFRAPGHQRLIGDFVNDMLETIDPDARYSDPDLTPTNHPGAIRPEARERVRSILRQLTRDDDVIDRWFGRYITEPQRGQVALPPEQPIAPATLMEAIQAGTPLWHGAASRLAYMRHDDGTVSLFIDGQERHLPGDLAFAGALLTDQNPILPEALARHLDQAAFVQLLVELVNDGVLDIGPLA
jgi:50S ribosomal protein L16 3-hydroxylase